MPTVKIQHFKCLAIDYIFATNIGAQGILRGVFSNRVINRWNALDQSAVDAPSINAFKQTSEGQE